MVTYPTAAACSLTYLLTETVLYKKHRNINSRLIAKGKLTLYRVSSYNPTKNTNANQS